MRKLKAPSSAIRQRPPRGKAGSPHPHESAQLHVTGKATYVDDLPELPGTLHIAVGASPYAHAKIKNLELTQVIQAPGVVKVLTLDDVPGHHDIGAVFPGDELFADEETNYVAQPLFAVVATSFEEAQRACQLANVTYYPLPAILTIEQAMKEQAFVRPPHSQVSGDFLRAIESAPHQLKGQQYLRGQEHFYLEGQVAYAQPTETGGMQVYCSSQHPTEVQKLVAEVLDLPIHQVQIEVRRMGGGFGGKETQAAFLACIATLGAHVTGLPVKFRMPRKDDMVMTGKRHDFFNQYHIGFNNQGVIEGADLKLAGKCGHSPDLSDAIVDRAMFHADNAYCLNHASVTGLRCRTHTVSNTAFRGFGGPQGMMLAEQMMDDIARHVGEDPLTIRKRNLYGVQHEAIRNAKGQTAARDTTHYGQKIEQSILPKLIAQLENTAQYWKRREDIRLFNSQSAIMKKGLALTPVKFGISFTVKHLNQAGALVHIYTDGSIHLNHGGTEMGQGLFTKVAQVVAQAFQVDIEQIQVSSTRTDKVPNTSPTAASSGADLNGMAALDACEKIKSRLVDFVVSKYGVERESVRFENNHVIIAQQDKRQTIPFPELVQDAYMNRISLSATGFYKTPVIHYDRESGQGHPFFYFAHGAAVSEVLVDTLTGENRLTRVDILHDVGQSLNPALDKGQIEGGFIQGMGWLTTEELLWDDDGRLISNSPANYKIPTIADTPPVFNVALLENMPNPAPTVFRSKAVGEPPFMLAISVWCALRDAVASLADYRYSPPLDAPATPEAIFKAIQDTQQWVDAKSKAGGES